MPDQTSFRLPSEALTATVALLLALALVPAPAEGRLPVKDSGRIDVGPGWRYEPLRGSNSFGGAARFGWHIDSRYFLGIEAGFWTGSVNVDRLGLANPQAVDTVRMMVGDIRFALGAHLFPVGPAWIYGVAGGGYHVVGVFEDSKYKEGATQGLFVGAGAYGPLSDRLGLFIENRFTFLSRIQAELGGETPTMDAGGNLLWAGLVVFFEPEPRPTGLGR